MNFRKIFVFLFEFNKLRFREFFVCILYVNFQSLSYEFVVLDALSLGRVVHTAARKLSVSAIASG